MFIHLFSKCYLLFSSYLSFLILNSFANFIEKYDDQVKAMVIINPGNPTGQCFSEGNLREILKFCYEEDLVLLGDEVYQQNIYQDERPFISARKVHSPVILYIIILYWLGIELEFMSCY